MDGAGRQRVVLSAIRTVERTGSTNADLLAEARAGGAVEGDWLRAGRQLGGRGRLGREWVSPVGNLYASTVVRSRPGDPAAATLGFVAVVALEEVVRALRPTGVLAIKWPNDVLLDDAKLSGILLERTDDTIIVGIGVNLGHAPDVPGRRTTCLAQHGRSVAASAFLDQLAPVFGAWLGRWRREGFGVVRQRWLERAHPPGTRLRAVLPDGSVLEGAFEELDETGALILCLAGGMRRAIHAGDVFLV